MMETMIPPQVGMRLRTKNKIKKKKKKREAKKSPTKGDKERRGNVTILFPHLCFRVAPCYSYSESPMLSLSYTSGNFSL